MCDIVDFRDGSINIDVNSNLLSLYHDKVEKLPTSKVVALDDLFENILLYYLFVFLD